MKFQMTKVNSRSQFDKQASESITANLPWEDVCAAMEESPDANIDYALHALKDGGRYTFHNADGDLVKVLNHKH